MNKISSLIILSSILLFTGCTFLTSTLGFKDKTQEFVQTALNKDYDKCLNLMVLSNKSVRPINADSLKSSFADFAGRINHQLGNKLEFTLMRSEKIKSIPPMPNDTPPNTTRAFIQVSNEKQFGVLKVLFDDTSGKIINIDIAQTVYDKPNMLFFWLFSVFPLIVLAFNIAVIRKIKKSSLEKKWKKYLGVIFFNIPSINYFAVGKLTITLLKFQIFGIGLNLMGYLGSIWYLGIPLGGIYWFLKLKKLEKAEIRALKIEEPNISLEQ